MTFPDLLYFLAYALIALIATGMLGPTNVTNPSVQIQGRRG